MLFVHTIKGDLSCPTSSLPFTIWFSKAASAPSTLRRPWASYSTLLREINPFDDGAKLGAETLVDIMKVTENIQPLQHIAEEFGYELKRSH